MLAGHYSAAYALRAARPTVPLWLLFVAVQAVDIVFFVFALVGIETVAVIPGVRGPLAMDLISIPHTHSLLMNLVYAGALFGAGVVLKRRLGGALLAAALLSHWLLDLFVHTHDLPLTPVAAVKVGMGFWHYPIPAMLLEVILVAIAAAALWRRLAEPDARRWVVIGAVTLLVIQLGYVLGPPPATVPQMAVAAEAIYVVMAVLAYQVDRRVR